MKTEAQQLLDSLAALPEGTVCCETCAARRECQRCVILDMPDGKAQDAPRYIPLQVLFCSAYAPVQK